MADIGAMARDPLSAISGNPAWLAGLPRATQISMEAFGVDAELRSKLGERSDSTNSGGVLPEAAFALPLGDGRLVLGGGTKAFSATQARFFYTDPPGTLGVSYGPQKHEATYVVGGAALGLGWQATERLALGLQASVLYNRNQLRAPYIFQSHPVLKNLKVLVDLDANDIGWSYIAGLDYALSEALQLSVAYGGEADFSANGDLQGNLGRLGLGIRPTFNYNANVKTALPAFWSLALVGRVSPTTKVGLEYKQVQWQDNFETLPITLTDGDNAELNQFLGSTSLIDSAPLDWNDQDTWHIGLEQSIGEYLFRLGYDYSTQAVPTSTMTPMTGAIFRNGFSMGLTMPMGERLMDVYYRFSTSSGNRHVNDSILAAGEHNGYALRLNLHSIGVSVAL